MGPGIITPPPQQNWEELSQPAAVPRARHTACHLIRQGLQHPEQARSSAFLQKETPLVSRKH